MAWWNGKQKAQSPWDCAKEITKAQAQQEDLPLGWYIYRDGYVWYGLRPNTGNTALERSFHRNSPKELEEWLGIPIPETSLPQAAASSGASGLDALISLTASAPPSAKPAEEEQDREDTQLVQDIQALEQDIRDTEEALNMPPPDQQSSVQTAFQAEGLKQEQRGRTRNNEFHVWFSDAELARFRRRVQRSGLNQSEFMRRAALTGKIVIEERDPVSVAILDELELIRAELGRQGGMLKMVIRPNQGQRELHPEEWNALVQAIRYLEHTKERLGKLEEKL